MSYRGAFSYNQRCGEGTMLYSNGQKYSGAWADGERCGSGRMEYLNGDVYEGEWHHDVRHGQGTLYLADGDVYVLPPLTPTPLIRIKFIRSSGTKETGATTRSTGRARTFT